MFFFRGRTGIFGVLKTKTKTIKTNQKNGGFRAK